MAENKLAHQFAAYTEWRQAFVDTICDYRSWLNEQELNDGQIDQRIQQLLERLRYQKELAKLERACKEQFNTAFNMIANEKMTLTSKFFETLASRVIPVYEVANRDVENWLKAVIAPMESQVREHQLQLRRRLESIKRIYQAADTLEDRIGELEGIEKSIQGQVADLKILRQHMKNALEFESSDKDAKAA